MKQDHIPDIPPGESLREQAERQLQESPSRPPGQFPLDPAAVVHELQVHQIELEHQNEELRRALLAAEEAHGKYLDLFDLAPIGYFTFDRQGLIQEANLTGCDLLGVTRERLLGRRFPLFVDTEFRGHFAALLRRVFEAPGKRVVELKLDRQDGQSCWVQLEAVAADVAERPGAHCRAAVIDISAQKLAQEEVMRLNQTLEQRVEQRSARVRVLAEELERFTYDVATDLEAPLRHIQSFTERLREQPTGEQAQRSLDHIQHSATRMQGLIAALLDFSRASRMRMRLTAVPLEQVLKEVRKKLASELTARPVQLTHEALPVVQADSGAMQIVFRQLLGNALKFTRGREEARIWVSAQETPSEYVIGVRDNGVGFNMRYRDRLFNVFQRLHSERDYEGAGVGLATVRRVVSRYGGRVWAEGKVGEGATFYVALPKQPTDLD
ncbi:histidine kinase [Deinococcus phoenicis]|uniref:histidine kinase n=1 Tax=Deinococcus phoenicis TaxID=1476583 RepID=A0A016QU96_9DEIO|nr:ATP-binding protein [Deinococcus phoenicis]EYB69457.1 histidine kinase [Deinococcus phoenicis]